MDPITLTISELLNPKEGTYIIPLYQRNYAWGRDEINQLLEDIKNSEGSYYLGTLVVAAKGENKYEIIDGQQRHTTLSIINAVFKNIISDEKCITKRNLYFEAREKTEKTIDSLLFDKSSYTKTKEFLSEDKGIGNIIKAVQYVEEFLSENFNPKTSNSFSESIKLKNYVNRFYSDLSIFRVIVPETTDLNHYFEIMNNRGEQLENHEILKAAFMKKIENIQDKNIFSKVWDACSQMNSHVQMNFATNKEHEKNDRRILFGEDNSYLPTKENMMRLINDDNNNDKDEFNINDILKNHNLPTQFNQNEQDKYTEKFRSIIDFPNFLLLTYKLENKDARLDDKYLLKDYGYPDNLPQKPMEFIFKLLKARTLFDKYIIKREGDSNSEWSIKTPTKDDYNDTFDEENFQEKIRMIQSMLQVTFTTDTYKNWLFNLLKFINQQDKDIKAEDLLNQLNKQAIKYYKENINTTSFSSGLHTPRFLFNYLDYCLWIKYYEEVRGKEESESFDEINKYIAKSKKGFSTFSFTQRSSVEHLFPQSKSYELLIIENEREENENEEQLKDRICNSFGNLCLISSQSNSSYNNDYPAQKKKNSESNKRNESLKQLIMFEMIVPNEDIDKEWNTEQIISHEKEMKGLLESFTQKQY
jgi:Uncharacterized conserved protein